MALLQSLFALVSRSAGKILNAIFGWAVRALFGRASAKDNTMLSALVAAAAVWPLLVLGLVVPKLAALVLGFIPIPHWVPDWIVRLVWAGLVLIVPCAIGVTVAIRAPAHMAHRSFLRRLLSGFPITVGLAITFVFMFVTVPIVRIAAMLRGARTADVPLVTESKAYHATAALCFSTLNAHGFTLRRTKPAWWAKVPFDVLRFFSGDAFAAYVPDEVEHFETDGLDVSFYTSGALLRGRGAKLTWAQGLIAEATAKTPGLQTSGSAAQEIERAIKRLWQLYLEEPIAHADSPFLVGRTRSIATQLATTEVDFDDWQVLYRQLLQLERGLHGSQQLLEDTLGRARKRVPAEQRSRNGRGNGSNGKRLTDPQTNEEIRVARTIFVRAAEQEVNVETNKDVKRELRLPPPSGHAKRSEPPRPVQPSAAMAAAAASAGATLAMPDEARPVADLSTIELVREITADVTRLAQKEIELAKTELKADVKAEAMMLGGLSIAALAGLCTINLLLVTAVFGLATVLPGWAAGFIISGITLLTTAIIAWLSWRKRVRKPLERTQRTLKDDVQWTKERLV